MRMKLWPNNIVAVQETSQQINSVPLRPAVRAGSRAGGTLKTTHSAPLKQVRKVAKTAMAAVVHPDPAHAQKR